MDNLIYTYATSGFFSYIVVLAIKGLAQNKREYGVQYCGCRQVTGDAKKDKDLICPCIHRTLDIRKRGSCKCGLFVK
jgi:ferredoxin-thioredoxin reductase catalytic chain